MSQSTASLLKSGDNVVQGDTTTDSMWAFSQKIVSRFNTHMGFITNPYVWNMDYTFYKYQISFSTFWGHFWFLKKISTISVFFVKLSI